MVTRDEAETWAKAQDEAVIDPTPASWFKYEVTEGEVAPPPPDPEPPAVPDPAPEAPSAPDSDPAAPPVPAPDLEPANPEPAPEAVNLPDLEFALEPVPAEPTDFNAMTKNEIVEWCSIEYGVDLDLTLLKSELVTQAETLEAEAAA
jgi:hypothetical protein